MKLVTYRAKADGPRLGVVAVATVAISVAVVACAGPWASGPPPIASLERVAAWASAGRFMNWEGHAIFYRASS